MKEDMIKNKKAIRREVLRQRKQCGPLSDKEIAFMWDAISLKIAASDSVAGYWPMASELDCRPILKKLLNLGHCCALPVINELHSPLIFRCWQEGDSLEEGPHCTFQPDAGAKRVDPDVVLVPMVAFDAQGGRLGYGGGYYDRTLQRLRTEKTVISIGLAFDMQAVPEVPLEPTDQRLDWIVTPSQVIKGQAG